MATLRDLGVEPFVAVPAGRLPVTAPGDRWVVLTGDGGPVSAVAPGRTLAAGARLPVILVAAADLEQADAFDSDAFGEFLGVSALVLTEAGPAPGGPPAVAGVVSDRVLQRAMFRGAARGAQAATGGAASAALPGAPSVPLISRSCGYAENQVTCATRMEFRRRPSPLPQCPNERHLADHQFAW